MRRVILAFMSTLVGLVMLLSFKTHGRSAAVALSTTGGDDTASTPTTSTGNATSPTTTGTAAAGTSGDTTSPTTTTGAQTVTGEEAETRYGPVEVKITVADGKITAVDAIEYPSDTPRDWQINQYAIPVLDQEATGATSAQIDMVSGATYTSQGYITSLQRALDKAGIS
jgi:uncharacterized protein with FMN-binding domain